MSAAADKKNKKGILDYWRVWIALLTAIVCGVIAMLLGEGRHAVMTATAANEGTQLPWRILVLFGFNSFVPMLPIWRPGLQRLIVATGLFLATSLGFIYGYMQ